MTTAVLLIFHGPRVEGSLSGMTDIIESKSGRLDIESYDAMQTVKYALVANQVSISINPL